MLIALTLTRAWANDTAAVLAAGGLVPVRSDGIAMESEDLRISLDQVSVRYRFRNVTDPDIESIVAFPLPPLNGAALANIPVRIPSQDVVNYMGFQVTVDGRPVRAEVEIRAFFEDKEITADLRALGIPLSVRDPGVTAAVARLTDADRARLKQRQWVDCALTRDGRCWPYWESRIQYYWRQRFPARASIDVVHTYRPVVGGGGIPVSTRTDGMLAPYCGDAAARAQIDRWKAAHPAAQGDQPVVWEQRLHYILTTGNNWRGPIGRFHLTVSTDSPDDLVSTCLEGLRRTAPTRYELVRTGYRPARELELQIVQRARPRGTIAK